MAVVITDETLAALRMTEEDFRHEVAVVLFRDGRLTLARAAELAALPRISFQKLLASRRIPVRYDFDDFCTDLKTLRDAGLP